MKTTVLPYQILPHSVFKVQLPSMTKQRLSFFFATNKCRDLISCSGLLQKDFRKKKTVITILACLQRRKEKSQGKERRATQFSLSHVTSFFFFLSFSLDSVLLPDMQAKRAHSSKIFQFILVPSL